MKIKSIFLFGLSLILVGCGTNKNVNSDSKINPPVEEIGEDAMLLKPDGFFAANPGNNELKTTIAGHNLSLESSVQIVYYVKNDNQSYIDKGLLVWKTEPNSYSINNYEFKLNSSGQQTIDDVTYDVYRFNGVAAKEMRDYVYAVSYVNDGQNYSYSEPDRYSVHIYCTKFRNSTETFTRNGITLGEMVKGILDYGSIAQKYFDYETYMLANYPYFVYLKVEGGKLSDGFNEITILDNHKVNLVAQDPVETYKYFDHWRIYDYFDSESYYDCEQFNREIEIEVNGDTRAVAIYGESHNDITIEFVRQKDYEPIDDPITLTGITLNRTIDLTQYIKSCKGYKAKFFINKNNDTYVDLDDLENFRLTQEGNVEFLFSYVPIQFSLMFKYDVTIDTSKEIHKVWSVENPLTELPIPEDTEKTFVGWELNGELIDLSELEARIDYLLELELQYGRLPEHMLSIELEGVFADN